MQEVAAVQVVAHGRVGEVGRDDGIALLEGDAVVALVGVGLAVVERDVPGLVAATVVEDDVGIVGDILGRHALPDVGGIQLAARLLGEVADLLVVGRSPIAEGLVDVGVVIGLLVPYIDVAVDVGCAGDGKVDLLVGGGAAGVAVDGAVGGLEDVAGLLVVLVKDQACCFALIGVGVVLGAVDLSGGQVADGLSGPVVV